MAHDERNRSNREAPLDCVAVVVVRSGRRDVGGFVLHKLALTPHELARLSVRSDEPEILGIVMDRASTMIADWSQR